MPPIEPINDKTVPPTKAEECDDLQIQQLLTEPVCDDNVARRMRWKADLILLPTLAIAYLLNSLDRSNLSNAHTAGLVEDLHLKKNQFNQVLTYYFVVFVALGPVGVVATKRYSARYSLAAMQLGFGVASFATTWVKSYGTLLACRLFVALFEAGYLASIIYYLSIWYNRKELAARLGIFYAALVASSAFGGLLSFGVFHITSGPYPPWAYLFLLEGSLTIVWAFVLIWILPADSQSAWFLTDSEKLASRISLQYDSPDGFDGHFVWQEAILEFKTCHPYVRAVMNFCNGVVLISNANFLAMVVERLGYSTVKTNLYTVAPSLTAACCVVIWSKSSDHFAERGLHCVISGIVSLAGYIILLCTPGSQKSIMYFAIFLCTAGAYPTTPIGSAWTVGNIPNLNARALTNGVIISVGNAGGLLASNIFLENEAPRYWTSLVVNIILQSVSITIALSYTLWMRWENHRRDLRQATDSGPGAHPTPLSGTQDQRFRFQA